MDDLEKIETIGLDGSKKTVYLYDIVEDRKLNCLFAFYLTPNSNELKVSLLEKKDNYTSFQPIINNVHLESVKNIIQSRKEEFDKVGELYARK
jgi:hypothetical protein